MIYLLLLIFINIAVNGMQTVLILSRCRFLWPRSYERNFKLNSAEHEIVPAHIKMPIIVGISTFMSRKNSILCLSGSENA